MSPWLKLLSGRFILTVIAGATFCYLACTQILDPKDSQTIIGIIVTFYFTKARQSDGNGNGEGNGNGNGEEPTGKPPTA